MKKINYKKTNKYRGFTLIETLISTVLFTFVTFVAIVGLFSLQDFNRKLKVISEVYRNVYLSIDIISSDLKQAANFVNIDYTDELAVGCHDIPSSCIAFDYLNVNTGNSSDINGYVLKDGKIKKYVAGGISGDITSDEVTITDLKFIIMGANSYTLGDTQQPMVKIILKGKSKTKPVIDFYTENIISQRALGN